MANVLIIDNSVAFTGAFKCALNEADALSDQYRFIFVLPENSTVAVLAKEKGYAVYMIPMKELSRSTAAVLRYPFFLLGNLIRLKRIIREEKIDIIQTNDFYNLLGAALKATGFRGRLLTYVRFLPSTIPAPLRRLWITAARKHADYIIAVSDAVLQQLPPDKKNIRIYDPVQLKELHHDTRADSKTKILLYLANFTRGKGQEHAIEAFEKISRLYPGLRLKFIGGDMGLAKNASFRQELQQKVAGTGLKDVVSFHNFAVDVEYEIRCAWVLLNFSEAESFSMTCLEASYYGTPVIATRCGGPEEIIVHDQTGFLVDKKNIDAMVKAISILADNELKRDKLGNAATIYVREKFSVQHFKQSMVKILG